MPLRDPDDSGSLFHASTQSGLHFFSAFGSCSSFPLSPALSWTPHYSTVYLLSPRLSTVTVCSAASKLVCHQSYAKIFGCEHRNAGLIQLSMEARQREAVFTPASWIFTEDGPVWSETPDSQSIPAAFFFIIFSLLLGQRSNRAQIKLIGRSC